MERYGDLGELMKKLTTATDGTKIPDVDCDNFPITFTLRDLKRLIRELPTADVVPRAEVDRLQRKYDLAVAEREANVKGFAEELSKAKAEVAREIFAEIEKILNKRFVPEHEEGIFEVSAFYSVKIGKDIAELRKKYMEGET